MKYIDNKKGQGFDTFKLLIAAVVAMVILGIVTGVFGKVWDMLRGISCVSRPLSEFAETIQEAQAGGRVTTGDICMSSGQYYDSEDIADQLATVLPGDISFNCYDNAAVCATEGGALKVTQTDIEAMSSATFKARITCDKLAGGAGNYECRVEIVNP